MKRLEGFPNKNDVVKAIDYQLRKLHTRQIISAGVIQRGTEEKWGIIEYQESRASRSRSSESAMKQHPFLSFSFSLRDCGVRFGSSSVLEPTEFHLDCLFPLWTRNALRAGRNKTHTKKKKEISKGSKKLAGLFIETVKVPAAEGFEIFHWERKKSRSQFQLQPCYKVKPQGGTVNYLTTRS